MMKTYYKVKNINGDHEQLIVAVDYAEAVAKLIQTQDFEFLFGDGFQIVYGGKLLN